MDCSRPKETRKYIVDLLHSINAKVNRALRSITSDSNLSLEDLNDIRVLTSKIELADKRSGSSLQTEIELLHDHKK